MVFSPFLQKIVKKPPGIGWLFLLLEILGYVLPGAPPAFPNPEKVLRNKDQDNQDNQE
jgi:hypothetical protein